MAKTEVRNGIGLPVNSYRTWLALDPDDYIEEIRSRDGSRTTRPREVPQGDPVINLKGIIQYHKRIYQNAYKTPSTKSTKDDTKLRMSDMNMKLLRFFEYRLEYANALVDMVSEGNQLPFFLVGYIYLAYTFSTHNFSHYLDLNPRKDLKHSMC